MLSYALLRLVHKIRAALKLGRRRIVVGTRDSVLAMAQTSIVVAYLELTFPELDVVVLSLKTAGDKNQVTALHEMERKSLWTEELEELLLEGKVDLIVHSLKGESCVLSPRAAVQA